MDIIALTTCHNRRGLTLRALRTLLNQNVPSGYRISICVVDGGSTDGTADAVEAEFPQVALLRGSSDLYWAAGMRFGWERYVRRRDPDYLLAFNDDISLYAFALERLLAVGGKLESQNCDAYAVSGAFVNPASGATAYGGAVKSSWWHPLRFRTMSPSDVPQECDTVNMNCTLISRRALHLTGFLADDFVHARADYDFGLRLIRGGGRAVLAPGYIGECSVNDCAGTSLQRDISISEQWRRLTGVKEQPFRERAVFFRRHGGRFWALYWALPYVRTFVVALLRSAADTLLRRRRKRTIGG